ncbi:hypothetical protein VNO77_18350 [Canavalia gladiata]|uniref:Uncharacterized protein n=1 Tax=Canavalia gladiata TaxID=3824 RepID=A0AAN9LQL8_CANGL
MQTVIPERDQLGETNSLSPYRPISNEARLPSKDIILLCKRRSGMIFGCKNFQVEINSNMHTAWYSNRKPEACMHGSNSNDAQQVYPHTTHYVSG